MEQKVMEQIDKAYELAESKATALRKRYETLINELFTDEIISMIQLLHKYGIKEMDTSGLQWNRIRFARKNNGNTVDAVLWAGGSGETPCVDMWEKDYSPCGIFHLKEMVRFIQRGEEMVKFFEDNAEELIRFITQKYKYYTEEEMEELAQILSDLDYEEEPIKHIKVTVEWI